MKKITRILITLLSLVLLCSSIVGCQKQPNDDLTSNETNQNIEDDIAPFEISKNVADLKIWYEDDLDISSSVDLQNMILKIVDVIKDKTGATIDINSDKKYNEKDADKPGILIGKTTFAESKEIGQRNFKQHDYYVGILGNKLVVYGENENTCVAALAYLYQTLYKKQDVVGGALLFTAEDILDGKRTTYGIDHIFVDNKELCEYRIVISENATANELLFAYELQKYLLNNYGHFIEIVNDKNQANGKEILIGNTNRFIGAVPEKYYEICEANGNIIFRASGMLGYEGLFHYVKNMFWKSGRMSNHSVDKGFSYIGTHQGLDLNDGTLLGQETYGDIRCMFYNVFGWESEAGPISLRQEMQLEIIKSYKPDVMCFQEYSDNYAVFTNKLTQVGYSEVKVSGVKPFTPMFYNPAKLRIKDSGYWLYSGPNDVNSKSIVWAEFEVISTGKSFICMSTHFMFNQAGLSDPNAVRVSNARELINLISQLQSGAGRNNIPLLVGGDLNCGKTSDPVNTLINSGLVHAWDRAAVKNNSTGYHGYSTYDEALGFYSSWNVPKAGEPVLDHVFASSNTKVTSFVTLTDKFSLICSDHCPILVEFTFN